MSDPTPFENDIFISYAHIDDETPEGEHGGWITYFHKWLNVRVAQLYGAKPRIWRDPKLRGNDDFSSEIVDNLPKVAFFVCVLSPRYVKSEWCTRELETFSAVAERTGGLTVNNKARVFKVVKTPIPFEQHPGILQDLLGYEFFGYDDDGTPHEYDPNIDEDTKKHFAKVINDLARDISSLMEVTTSVGFEAGDSPSGGDTGTDDRASPGGARPGEASGKKVFLANTGYDLVEPHKDIRRFLEAEGCVVLPEAPLPPVADVFRQQMQGILDVADFTVHMVGKYPGITPDGAEEPVVALQHDLAAQAGRERLIWMPPGLETDNTFQRGFIKKLRDGQASLGGADLLEGSLEDFKIQLCKMIEPEPEVHAQVVDDGTKSVYLIHDREDLDAIKAPARHLFERGLRVETPSFTGEPEQVQAWHLDQLGRCDAVLIYYGEGRKPWFELMLSDLGKIFGTRRTEPFLAKYVLVSPPETPDKALILTREAKLIEHLAPFTPDVLDPFLAELQQG